MDNSKYFLLSGPVLFTIAQCILPGGSVSVAERLTIIAHAPVTWQIGHLLIAPSFILLGIGFFRWYRIASLSRLWLSGIGLLLLLSALFADYSIALLQLVTLELVRLLPPSQTLIILQAIAASTSISIVAFFPYLGWFIGTLCLGIPLLESRDFRTASACMMISGGLIVAGGLLQVPALLITGGVVLIAAFLLLMQTRFSM